MNKNSYVESWPDGSGYEIVRDKMVDEQLITRVIKSDAVLDAMRKVPRHLFVSENLRASAYNDSPLPIGSGQTISQPYIVAYMTEQLGNIRGLKILEIGTGSGYQAAILAYLGCEVYSIELVEELATKAKTALDALGFGEVKIRHGNGYFGWPEEAPFDAIIVTAAPGAIPERLVEQLKNGGKMIVPIGEIHSVQWLKLLTNSSGRIIESTLLPVRFVPMVE